jgi:hypothetical protein
MLFCHEFTQFTSGAAPQWLFIQPKYCPSGRDGHLNFAKAEDISSTANEENQRSCMSKKEETHAKRRINALHISILVQPDDYR